MNTNTARAAMLAAIGRSAEPPAPAPQPFMSGGVAWTELARRFTAHATAAAATVVTVPARSGVAAAIADYLDAARLGPEIHLSAPTPAIAGLALEPRLRCRAGPVPADGATLVSGCLAAVAAEGVVVLASGATHAAQTAFLAATHIVVVEAAQLVESLEALWQRLRALPAPLPRQVSLVLGPSRTADLGVPSRLGAHGPLRVHAILVGEEAEAR